MHVIVEIIFRTTVSPYSNNCYENKGAKTRPTRPKNNYRDWKYNIVGSEHEFDSDLDKRFLHCYWQQLQKQQQQQPKKSPENYCTIDRRIITLDMGS